METKIFEGYKLCIISTRFGDGVSAIGGSGSFVAGNLGGVCLISSPIGDASSPAVAEAMPLDPRQ